jgi:hypothetical protein
MLNNISIQSLNFKTRKILSIDVGIKNLAFCLLEEKSEFLEKSEFNILKWNVIDLTYSQTENENKTGCQCIEKNKNICCNKQAKFKKDGIHYCIKHSKKMGFLFPCISNKPSTINKKKIADLVILADSYKIIHNGCKKNELVSLINDYIINNSFEPIEKNNASKMDLVTIGKNIQSNLDALLKDDFLSIQTIVIENQISPIANRMKTIQGMIAQYFIMKKNGIVEIEFVSSFNKLKNCDKKDDIKLTYSDRKKLGVKKCLEIINSSFSFSNWKTFFIEHKKKDDLADSFLQGIWYLHC